MNLFDTHAHIDRFMQTGDWDAVRELAVAAGVTQMALIGGCPESNRCVLQALDQEHPGIIGAVGYDRDQAARAPDLPELDAALAHPGVRAVGEIGLDYHYHPETARAQRALFERMLERALTQRLPVAVHSREADQDTLAVLNDYSSAVAGSYPPGVLHCFTGGRAFAEHLLELGFHISFSGILTFPSAATLREVAVHIPTDRLLVETDCPFLAPVPHRGKRNEPAHVRLVAGTLADLRGETLEAVAEQTTRNAQDFFRITGPAP